MIKKVIKMVMYGNKSSSKAYIRFLRSKGCRIGENTTIYSPENTIIDITRPFLVEIGSNVEITTGCTILTHGYDWSVIKNIYGNVLGSAGKVKIGNNVFIGVNTTILKGSSIGNNVIIGANTLINCEIPDNVVVVGNPCKIICSLEEYFNKRLDLQLKEAVELYVEYRNVYDTKNPPIELFYEFFWLFDNEIKDNKFVISKFQEMMNLGGNYETSQNIYNKWEKKFNSYAEFIKYCEHCYNINNI